MKRLFDTSATGLTASLALLMVSACTVGPDYRGPPLVAPQADAAGAFRRAEGDTASATPPACWWESLQDPVLTELIERGLRQSPSLQAAEARIRQARAVLRTQQSDGLPKATATGAAIRATVPPGSPLAALGGGGSGGQAGSSSGSAEAGPRGRQAFNVFNAGFDATWELDLFGGVRRGMEGARARVDAQVARHEDVQVQLAAEIGQAYAGLRAQQLQIALADRIASAQQKLLELQQARSRGGTADLRSIEPARDQLIQTRAGAAPLPGQLAQSLDQLALLTGQEPGTLDAMLVRSRSDPSSLPLPLAGSGLAAPVAARMPQLPAAVAVGDPRAMLRRRPDVRAAERALASSNAAIGSAVAQRFPSVTLFGNIGFTNGQLPDLFQVGSLAALGGPILRWNFLNFGAVQAGIDQAEAATDEALATYRGAVLQALQDAESSLSRFGQQRRTLAQRIEGVSSAERQFQLARQRQLGGTSTMLDVWRAEAQLLQSDQARVTAEAELLRDFIALQKSLGLGWQPAAAS